MGQHRLDEIEDSETADVDTYEMNISQFKWVVAEHGGHERHVELVDEMLGSTTYVLWDRKTALENTMLDE